MVNEKNDDSQRRLEAMLYVLQDPSLDRAAFEARLADDAVLGEFVADAVLTYQDLTSIDRESGLVVCLPVGAVASNRNVCLPSLAEKAVVRPWFGVLAGLAASLLLVGYLGWKSISDSQPKVASHGNSSRVNDGSEVRLNNDTASLTKVVWAWGDLRTSRTEEAQSSQASIFESDIALAACESIVERDVPEWLVLATAAVLEQGGGVDSPLEQVDARTLIQ